MTQRRKPESLEPKPFFWIPLQKKPQKDKPALLDRFSGWNGRMELLIEVRSEYLFVGGGNFDLFSLEGKEQARYNFARRNGRLVVPGTGIKGAVRSVVEAISNSCVRLSTRRERGPSTHRPCNDLNNLCLACRLFGTTGYRGRAHFSDALPVRDGQTTITIKIADLWPPKQFKGRKFYQTKVFQPQDMRPQRNYRFLEVVPKGMLFRTTLFFENATTAEMGVLVRGLGLTLLKEKEEESIVYAFPVKLGGAKPRCLGSVRFHPEKIHLLSPTDEDLFLSFLTGDDSLDVLSQLLKWLADESLLDQDAWAEFREQAKPKRDVPCPKEVY